MKKISDERLWRILDRKFGFTTPDEVVLRKLKKYGRDMEWLEKMKDEKLAGW